MPSPARVIAAEVLTRVERDGAYASVSLDAAFAAAPQLDPRDTGLASELVLGTLRRKLALDAALEAAADRRMNEIEPLLQPLLRLGAYQLLYLDRVPAHAAVFETVELCKERGFGRAAGLCNAALRRLSRDPKVPLPSEPLQRLSVEESHPLWLVRRWAERFGLEETTALCRANNQPAPLNLRVNARRGTREARLPELRAARPEATIAPGQFSPTAISLTGVGPVTRLPGFVEGGFQVQDEAAQLVGLLVAPTPGSPTLDVCAAPGGKSCHLAEQGGEVLALDVSPQKLKRVAAEATRLGLTIRCIAADAQKLLPVPARSQRFVMVDAPCSGLGTLRRHPELRYRRRPEDLPRLVDLQRAILAQAAKTVAPGGVLVFAVCSSEAEEGLAQRAAFLATEAGWHAEGSEALGPPREGGPWSADGGLESWPHRHGIDGFTAFRLRRS